MTRLENAVRELCQLAPPPVQVRLRIALWELVHALEERAASSSASPPPAAPSP